MGQHTHDANDLAFESELVLKAASEVFDAATAIATHVRSTSDMVKHMAAAEEEDRENRSGSPDIAVLQNRQSIGVENGNANDRSDANGRVCYKFHPLKRSFEYWLWRHLRKLFRDPRMNHLGRGSATNR